MICISSFSHGGVDDVVVEANNASFWVTDSRSFGVVFCDVLAEWFVTKDGEKPAVGDTAKGLRAFTSESKNVSVTGVDLLLTPQPRDGF